MFVEALIPHEELRALIAQALPLTIRLDDTGGSHSLKLSELLEIALVPERGVRLVCKACLHWPLLGIDAPLTLNSLGVLLIPEVKPSSSGEMLAFGISLEHVDISGMPSVLDDKIRQSVNDRLPQVALSWDFSKTLARVVRLPTMLEELDGLRVGARWGKVRISEQALVFALCLQTVFVRGGDAGSELAPTATDAVTEPPRTDPIQAVERRAHSIAVPLAAVAVFGLAAGAAFFGLRAMASRW
jgi:hypothetical protein